MHIFSTEVLSFNFSKRAGSPGTGSRWCRDSIVVMKNPSKYMSHIEWLHEPRF